MAKSGTQPLQGVLRDYGPPLGKGYFIVVAKPHTSTFQEGPEGINQFAAHGAHLSLFTNGCGSTTGGLTPVIKIIANPNRMQLIADNADNADFDATPIIRGEQSIEQVGEQLYEEIITELGDKSSPLV